MFSRLYRMCYYPIKLVTNQRIISFLRFRVPIHHYEIDRYESLNILHLSNAIAICGCSIDQSKDIKIEIENILKDQINCLII